MEGVDSLGCVPARPPELSQCGGQPDSGHGISPSQAVGDRGPDVAELQVETVQPLGLIVPHQLWCRRFRESQVVVLVSAPGVIGRRRTQVFEFSRGVLTDGFQQPVASRPAVGVLESDEVLIDERAEESDDLVRNSASHVLRTAAATSLGTRASNTT
jgi:hypothetical protein